jgi:cytochrome c-type biogenesis protein CcmH
VKILAALLLALASLCAALPATAGEAVPTDADRVLQKRAIELEENLRCLVCQNQTIADSNAELAQDLRRQVREQIAQGRTDAEIVAYMVQRYGDFVLYKPPVKATTLLLWFGPGLLLLAGGLALFRNVRTRAGKRAAAPELTSEEHARASSLLDGGPGKDSA